MADEVRRVDLEIPGDRRQHLVEGEPGAPSHGREAVDPDGVSLDDGAQDRRLAQPRGAGHHSYPPVARKQRLHSLRLRAPPDEHGRERTDTVRARVEVSTDSVCTMTMRAVRGQGWQSWGMCPVVPG